MLKTFVITISCVLISASVLTNLVPDEKIKPFARLGVSFVILAVFLSSVLSLGKIDVDFLPTFEEPSSYQYNLKEALQENIEKDLYEKYGVKADAVISISDDKTVELEKLVLYEKKNVQEIKAEYRPKNLVVK